MLTNVAMLYQLLSNLVPSTRRPAGSSRSLLPLLRVPRNGARVIQQARRDIREYVDSFDYPRLQVLAGSTDEIKNLHRRCRNGYENCSIPFTEMDQTIR